MTGNELKRRREALGFSVGDLAQKFDLSGDMVEMWESLDAVPAGSLLTLALDQLDDLAVVPEGDAAYDALMACVDAVKAQTRQILAGRRLDPPEPFQALILAAEKAVRVIDRSVAIMRHKGEFPRTLATLTDSREELNSAVERALGVTNET